uniref:Uncharacterized protein n=1 Tax=Medicago truncatula TaxID=3880 RepID=A2Q1K9_MEDTR|nr:hypothetical protein MtrDRAFT_AC148918g23v2 [Medicago truncatula]
MLRPTARATKDKSTALGTNYLQERLDQPKKISGVAESDGESAKHTSCVTLTPQLRHLNIYREARKLVLNGQNALVPYNQQTGFMNMASSFPSSINSHGVDGTDEDKAKWWENE